MVTFFAGTLSNAHGSSGIFPKGTAQTRKPRPHASIQRVSLPRVKVMEVSVVWIIGGLPNLLIVVLNITYFRLTILS